jgi:molybdopterin synthase sulfur carrier subunit/adenylyltransferase/sulfurtransferase
MPTLTLPALMKYYVNDLSEVQITGSTVSQAINDLTSQYPAIKPHIIDNQGRLRRHVNLFINKENINNLNGLDTSIEESDIIILMPSITGG